MRDTRSLAGPLALAAAMAALSSVQAAAGVLPNESPYACTWLLNGTSAGVSHVSHDLDPQPFPDGIHATLRTVYHNGAVVTQPAVFVVHVATGEAFIRVSNISCRVTASQQQKKLVFDQCLTNGVPSGTIQKCVQYPLPD